MIIDFHTHSFPDQIAAAAIERLSRQGNLTPFSNGTPGGLLLGGARGRR